MCTDKPTTREQLIALYLHCQVDSLMLDIFNLMLKYDENDDEFHQEINRIRNESVVRIRNKLESIYSDDN